MLRDVADNDEDGDYPQMKMDEITNNPVLDSSTWSFVIYSLSKKGGDGYGQ